jgi:hypothetical protein
MPCDCHCYGKSLDEFNDILNEICVILLQRSPTYFIIGGDFNCDFSRNTPQVKALNMFLKNNLCHVSINSNVRKIDYTYSDVNGSYSSTIDRIVSSDNLADKVHSYFTLDDIDNASDHVSVHCKFDMPVSYTKFENKKPEARLNWSKASLDDIEKYKCKLDEYLDISFSHYDCHNIACDCNQCKYDIISMYNVIVESCSNAAYICIPKIGNGTSNGSRSIPGWSDIVEPAREKSLFWHRL